MRSQRNSGKRGLTGHEQRGWGMWAYFVIVLCVAVASFYFGQYSGVMWFIKHFLIEEQEVTK